PVLRDAGRQSVVLGEQLFTVVDALDGSGSLRRALTDPATDGGAKARLSDAILAAADPRVAAVVADLARSRWSAEADLAEAVEQLGFSAILAAAESDGSLQDVEDELFRLTKALAGHRELRRSLVDERATAVARADLVGALIAGKVHQATSIVTRRAAYAPRGRSFVVTLVHLGAMAAARRDRVVASVTSATELSAMQLDRLGAILERAYGRTLQLNVTVDSDVIGGLRIQTGADVVDSTMLARLAEARRAIAT
ncbi:MAG TPA: F0F1 ATP synthase subunit delta, partial [Cellulomonadaceae bacterium]|nr:F0F1 ATP synthase subunit delta [Cellulomonadaceae bacterium]